MKIPPPWAHLPAQVATYLRETWHLRPAQRRGFKRKISLRHCIHTGKQALMSQRRAPRLWKQACQTCILAVAASNDLRF